MSHPSKTSRERVDIEPGITTFFRDAQSANALSPSAVVEEGILISSKDLHPLKAFSSIMRSVEGSATFTCQFDGTGLKKPALLLEEEGLLGKYQIFINGKAAGTPVPKRVYDLTNLVLDVSALVADGQNELKIVFSEAGEFEGINSAIYVTDLLSWRER